MLGAHRPHKQWTVIQVETGLTFSALFSKIVAGTHPHLNVDEELPQSRLDKVFVGHTKDLLSIMDEQLIVDDVCVMFGQHVKFTATLPTTSEEPARVSKVNPLRNVFTIMMASQRVLDMAKLPPNHTLSRIK